MLSVLFFTEILLFILTGYMMITKSSALCVVISNIISAVIVFIYCILQAPDIAITEAVIGVATSTVLFALTLLYIRKLPIKGKVNENYSIDIRQRMVVFLLCSFLFFIFIHILQNIPKDMINNKLSGDRISLYYIKNALKDFTMASIVTSVVAGYRAFDTMFENVVIFTACYGFYTLLTLDLNGNDKHIDYNDDNNVKDAEKCNPTIKRQSNEDVFIKDNFKKQTDKLLKKRKFWRKNKI